MPNVEIRIDGLADLRRTLKRMENVEASVDLRTGLKRAADEVAQDAKGRLPSRTGAARSSLRATSGGNRAYVAGGGARVPYYGWLDFGSRNPQLGNPRSVGPWAGSGKGPDKGRAIYPAIDARETEVVRLVEHAVSEALRKAGL